jgi:hypothetical protein
MIVIALIAGRFFGPVGVVRKSSLDPLIDAMLISGYRATMGILGTARCTGLTRV